MDIRSEKIKRSLLGPPKSPLDPRIFHRVSLIAFFAWVGLGADGLSSSCYGPEEAFLALGHFRHLALFLAIAMALTVSIISLSYSQIIELFPTGGGGYLVATKLLGPIAGLVSGSALVLDYVLTISISIASGVDAIFSFLPLEFQEFKVAAVIFALVTLIGLNLRGVKESVTILMPIFLVFIITHAIVILFGIAGHGAELPGMVSATLRETHVAAGEIGVGMLLFIFLRAFTLGGGTYTGIEAVSNGLPILREPRVQTGKRTMLYMATSLSFVAGGILVAYLLNGVTFQPGKTLNASLIERVVEAWPAGGQAFLLLTLLAEGALLFVAAQTGFIDGPRVLSNMALDMWVPRRFAQLSDRLVIKDGILLMGAAALGIILYTRGEVKLLVVMYSINVFLTFSLSQLGMCIHWWKVRRRTSPWRKKLAVNAVGLALTSMLLLATVTVKFAEGGWVTLVLTSLLIAACLSINHHYRRVRALLRRLDTILTDLPLPENPSSVPVVERETPTAAVMVGGYDGLGIHSFLTLHRNFPNYFRNFVFLSVGVIDSGRFKGVEELEALRNTTEDNLKKYVHLANSFGFYAEYRYSLGIDVVDELEKLAKGVAHDFPHTIFFTGKLIFPEDNMATRVLHNQVAQTVQRRLHFQGMQVVILPIRVLPASS